ncbi:tumor necrosis factor ligand superfamily member 13B-like [Chiloscyllium plagiosum]|uniref:tumor necrosis factor ligand superfamily member 13B-like n=1 Tax=Chiloscyllium plagiosum TaxID=36176 RepID=UPI001CB85BB0|nr:tumor necrosis factor ligand superfamily member 13B-like [Chiloscyllium plagiosum]
MLRITGLKKAPADRKWHSCFGLLHQFRQKAEFVIKMNAVHQKTGFDIQHRCLIFSACVLTSAALMSTYVAAVALHHVLALRAEISSMREELESYKFQLDRLAKGTKGPAANWSGSVGQLGELLPGRRRSREMLRDGEAKFRSRRSLPEQGRQSFVQLIATSDQRPAVRASNCQKCLPGRHQQACRTERRPVSTQSHVEGTLVPWMLSLKKGTALDRMGNKISVKEAGFFLIYSQVWYKDNIFTMGHFIKRIKAHIVGSEPRTSILFRCIQNMPACCPNNSCFTAGVAKLEAGDELELVIPRVQAHVALNGDGTFFGAIQLP